MSTAAFLLIALIVEFAALWLAYRCGVDAGCSTGK